MDIGNKRHGKKSDKETQSPVLKVFKEMIQRENDPEKANLLKEKQERKRRQYSGSRSKLEKRSCDSSSSEKNRRSVQYKVAVHEQRLKDYNERSQSIPFQGDKKDSWWFWSDTQKKRSEDTCSCVSCALKKIVSSEYTCIACLGVLFLLSVLVAFLVLFRTVPIVAKSGQNKPTAKKPRDIGSDVMRKKIDMIQRGCKGDGGEERPLWDDTMTRRLNSLTRLNGNDFDDGSYREMNTLEESGRSESELSSILDAEKLNDGLSSERLRNFYKKLIQTDAQIRNLKKSVNDYSQTNFEDSRYAYPDRSKRSLKVGMSRSFRKNVKKETNDIPIGAQANPSDLGKFNIFYPPSSAVHGNIRKHKRFANGTDEPTGFLIEKKQIVVQYRPNKKVPKCSHAPKDSKSHEKQLKHPFYKNTQRLDELLDQFLDRNLPEMMADPFGVDTLFKKNKDGKSHKTNVKIEHPKLPKKLVVGVKPVKNKNKEEHRDHLFDMSRIGGHRLGDVDREFFDVVSNNKNGMTSSTASPSYDVILSVSTIVNPGLRKVSKPMTILARTPSLLERVPNLRKLMQVDEEDEEGLGYEDFKEVLADDTEAHDETDKIQDRKKRMDDYRIEDLKIPNNPYKYNPPGVHNPNWKGPMPLYPDELSSMIKQAAIQNLQYFNKIQAPTNAKELSSESETLDKDLNDMEYIENYSDKRFNRLAKMAQAYSDYGVLEGKKDTAGNEKEMDGKNAERRVKLSINKGKSFKAAFLDRFKKSKSGVSEGIRFEIRPTTSAREDSPLELLKALEKHVKVTNNKYFPPFHSTTLPLNTEYALFTTAQKQQGPMTSDMPMKKAGEGDEYPDNAVIFTFAKSGRRSLKSVEDDVKTIDVEDLKILNNDKSIDGTLTAKGFSGLDVKRTTNVGSDKEQTNVTYNKTHQHHHHHHNHHSSHHHHHDVSNASKIDSNKDKEAKSSNNKTEIRLKHEDVSANNTNNSNSDNDANVFKDNNLISTILNLNTPSNSSDMALSDFFMLMSNWFSVMAGFDTTSETNAPKSNIIKLTTKSDMSTAPKNNETINIQFPLYDSDMIENIGHRSRVLMSVEENDKKSTDATDVTEISTSGFEKKDKEAITANSDSNSIKEITAPSILIITNEAPVPVNATSSKSEEKETSLAKTDNNLDNKTVVKRNIPGESNLIFWNDIYDDEYGVKMDPIDDAMLDKHNTKSVNFMKKSGNWIQDKVKNFANNFRGREKSNMNDRSYKRRVLRRANYGEDSRNIYTKYDKRATKYEEGEAEEKTSSFVDLTAKMKEVCKEAAKAVQQTKNVQVRQDAKEDSMTTSLMQQLVRLMTDLIDFQVQQKTCVKLPPDLQEFLVWLTSPTSEQVDFRDQKMSLHSGNNYERPPEQVLDLVTTPSSEKEEIHAESRSECLGTLHAVQDLMQQYDEMTDEDKSKMTGIRDYLENQLQFLHKQLTTFDDYNMSNSFEDQNPSYRFRRDLSERNRRFINKQIKIKNRFKRRFLKNFGKKHTRTTASIYDGFAMTETSKYSLNDDGKDENNNIEREAKNVKRNLKDVYYKALNDAKTSTTFKTGVKDEVGFDHAQIVRIDN